jgi:hypothetical protein
MKRMLITMTVIAGITFAFLFAMSVPGFGGTTPPPPECDTACVGPQGQVKLACCETDDDCSGEDSNGWVCLTLLGGGGGDGEQVTQSCPSVIGGGGSGSNGSSSTFYFPYFLRFNGLVTPLGQAEQSVETAGSIRGLNVIRASGTACSTTFTIEINDGTTVHNGPSCGGSGADECVQSPATCIDVDAGNKIALKGTRDASSCTGSPRDYNHSTVFDGCLCCDGMPPVDGTCVRPTPTPMP